MELAQPLGICHSQGNKLERKDKVRSSNVRKNGF